MNPHGLGLLGHDKVGDAPGDQKAPPEAVGQGQHIGGGRLGES